MSKMHVCPGLCCCPEPLIVSALWWVVWSVISSRAQLRVANQTICGFVDWRCWHDGIMMDLATRTTFVTSQLKTLYLTNAAEPSSYIYLLMPPLNMYSQTTTSTFIKKKHYLGKCHSSILNLIENYASVKPLPRILWNLRISSWWGPLKIFRLIHTTK